MAWEGHGEGGWFEFEVRVAGTTGTWAGIATRYRYRPHVPTGSSQFAIFTPPATPKETMGLKIRCVSPAGSIKNKAVICYVLCGYPYAACYIWALPKRS